mmetsp:Transcript_33632/g.53829  ORF Transcript_33632/g.53829 Transcript_33632/m.53829 type:complete len:250 (-) Transcript_33632:360-1109(-)
MLGRQVPLPTGAFVEFTAHTSPIQGVEITQENRWRIEGLRADLHFLRRNLDRLLGKFHVVALLDGMQAPDAELGVALEDHGAADPAVPRNGQLFGPRMTPVRVVKVVSTPIMFLSPGVDGGIAGGLCDVVQFVVGFLKVGDVDLVPLQHVAHGVEATVPEEDVPRHDIQMSRSRTSTTCERRGGPRGGALRRSGGGALRDPRGRGGGTVTALLSLLVGGGRGARTSLFPAGPAFGWYTATIVRLAPALS